MSAHSNDADAGPDEPVVGPREAGNVESRVLVVCYHPHPEGRTRMNALMDIVREAGCTIYYTSIHRYEFWYVSSSMTMVKSTTNLQKL